MPITVVDALKRVKEQAFGEAEALALLQDSAAAGFHPDEHILDWAPGGSHIAGTGRDRKKLSLTRDGFKLDSTSVFFTRGDAVVALIYGMNTNGGELAMTKLSSQPTNGRVTIHSRSAAYGSAYKMGDRWESPTSDTPSVNPQVASWVTTVFQKQASGELAIVTHYPNPGGGKLTPAHQCDLVEYPGGHSDCHSSESGTGTAVRAFRWIVGCGFSLKHSTFG